MAINPQGQGQGIGGNVNRIAEEAKNKAQETAQSVGHRAQEAGTAFKHRSEEAIGSVGQQMSNLGSTIREKAPHEGMLGSAACGVASTLESSGRYLQEHDLQEIGREVTGLVRRYPFAAIGVCFGLGCLLGLSWNRR